MGNWFSHTADTSDQSANILVETNVLEEKDRQIQELQQKISDLETKLNKTQKKRRRSFSSISVLDESNTTIPYEQHSEFLVPSKLDEDSEDTLNLTVSSDKFMQQSSPDWKKLKILDTSIPEEIPQTMVVAISGFKQSSEHIYNRTVKKRITQYIEQHLPPYTASNGATITVQLLKEDASKPTEMLDDSITHIICPPQSRTFKVLQAVLTHKWIICPEWVVQSYNNGRWLHESGFGFKRMENPIENRSIYLSHSFDLYCNSSKNASNYIPNLKDHCYGLARIGKAVFVNEPENADYILVGPSIINVVEGDSEKVIENKDKAFYSTHFPKLYVVEWAEFIELLYPQYLESTLRKAAELYPITE